MYGELSLGVACCVHKEWQLVFRSLNRSNIHQLTHLLDRPIFVDEPELIECRKIFNDCREEAASYLHTVDSELSVLFDLRPHILLIAHVGDWRNEFVV